MPCYYRRLGAVTNIVLKLSLKTFAKNVVNLAVENCLIFDLSTILTVDGDSNE